MMALDSGSTNSGAAIEVDGLKRDYGGRNGFTAVRGVSFRVERGELFALLGTNGAGKTSILEAVEGLQRPTAGVVRVFGLDPWRHRAAVRARTGIMLQEGGLPADLTVVETATMWARTLADPRPVGEALDLVAMGHRARVRVAQLSGGERRRLDLALAILGRPDLLLLDEPTAGLDPESRHHTWTLLRELLTDGVTVLLSTHHLEEAEALADRLAILHEGRVRTTGSPAEVVAAYPARISFDLPPGLRVDELTGLPGVLSAEVSHRGVVTIRTGGLQSALGALLTWAQAHAVTLSGLEARSASLEQAFLTVAGMVDRTPADIHEQHEASEVPPR